MIGKIFKCLCILIAVTVIGTLGFRLYTLNHYPAFASGILPTETLKQAYAAQEAEGLTREPRGFMEEAGSFFLHQPIYFPKQKTLIVTLRYNDSLLEKLKHDGSGETLPLDVTLYADGTKRVQATDFVYGYAYNIYSYRRYVFEGIDLADYTNLYIDVYHGEPDYTVAPYSSLEVYNTTAELTPYTWTAKDKRALQ